MVKREKIKEWLVTIVFAIICLLILFPFVLLVSVSLSSETDIMQYGYSVIPKRLDFSGYEYVLKNSAMIIRAYGVTITFSVVTMVLAVVLMAMIAYPLSKSYFKGKNIVSFYLYFTMLFSGGLVPSYILITRYLHLNNTIWVYIFPALISPWYVFMMRTFLKDIPEALSEAAVIDGATEWQIFYKIVMPLSKPVLATVALFTVLAKWNDWNTALLYINDSELMSLQYQLQRMLRDIQMLQESMNGDNVVNSLISVKDIPAETARMAMSVVVAGPALIVFPFFQKYFTKGLTVGGVKG